MTVDQKYRRMQYVLCDARADQGIKLRELEEKAGISPQMYRNVVYNKWGCSVLSIMRVAEALGYELVLKKVGGE